MEGFFQYFLLPINEQRVMRNGQWNPGDRRDVKN